MLIARIAVWITVILLLLWAAAALWFDLPAPLLRVPAALGLALAAVLIAWRVKRQWRKLTGLFLLVALVLTWWLTLKPRQDRPWQADVERTAWAEQNGDQITLHNVRLCEYRTESDYTVRWETRRVRLSRLQGVDLAICRWGSPYMTHPIASFQFADAAPICFSIETRKEIGERYSAIGGFYRQFELIYVVADERDVLRLRTNYRHGEDVYLYRTATSPDEARDRFLEYIAPLNALHGRPRWYNALTTNCTTSIRTQRAATSRGTWDWRILINGRLDELLYERGALKTGDLEFADLQKQALINPAAQAADNDKSFSAAIRRGRAGF